MCLFLEISRSWYYKCVSVKKAVSKVDKVFQEYGITSEELDKKVTNIYTESKRNYGSRKISKQLLKQNVKMSRYKVLKITKRLNLPPEYVISKAKPYKSFKQPDDSCENLLMQNFSSNEPGKIVTSDLSYIKVKNKFYYICFIVDLFNREIMSYSISDKHNTEMVLNAVSNYTEFTNLEIFHSDRGGEFRGLEFVNLLLDNDIKQSMSKPGCPFDNAVSESLFNIYKREWAALYNDIIELEAHVKEFVRWYNYFRIHSSNDYLTPVEMKFLYFENKSL
jgi:transposase InsO family protein